jgi:hypothetical protein
MVHKILPTQGNEEQNKNGLSEDKQAHPKEMRHKRF